MANMGKRWMLMAPEGEGAGGGGDQGAGGQGGQGGQGGSVSQAFADASAARAFLKDYVNDEGVLSAVGDDKIVPWASHVKTKVDEFGKQFPSDWRKLIAGDNTEHLKTLERFASPKALYDSYGALRAKMASGELKPVTPFPDKGSDEEKTAWRTTNGIPESPEKYEIKLPEGLVLGEAETSMVDAFKKFAWASNLPASAVNTALAFYATDRDRAAQERSQKEAEAKATAEDELRAEWGGGYRENIGRVSMLISSAPPEVAKLFGGARLADGTPLGNHPATLKWLVDLSRQLNPAGVIVPNDGSMAKSLDDEIASIEKVMRENRPAYNKDEKMQARLRDLYAARDKTKKAA